MNPPQSIKGRYPSRRTVFVPRSVAGYSLIELVVAVSVLGILTAIATPQFRASRLYINTTQRLLIANLRLARTNAISKSIHFQVSFPTATQIRVSRMVENPAGSGVWQVDAANVQTIPLPSGTQVKSNVVGTSYEFNSRGLTLNIATPTQIDAQDGYGKTKSLQVWPSGQVNEL